MLCEQIPFIFIHKVDDLVVLSDHNHGVFSQNTKILSICHDELIRFIGNPDVEWNQNFPSRDFVDQSQQFTIEIAFNMKALGFQQLLQFIILVVFVRSAQDSNGLDTLAEISRLFKPFVFILPLG